MSFIHNFSCNGNGRILLLWKNSTVKIELIGMDEQILHVSVCCLASGFNFVLSSVYGLHTIVHRRPLWENLKSFGQNLDLPWLLIGDFNNVVSPDEKIGGLAVTNHELRDITDCISHLELVDTQHVGCYFTWTNNVVCSKLDRVMVNPCWLLGNFDICTEFLPPGCISDHSLSITTFFKAARRRNIPFKFYNMWCSHADFENLIRAC
ncbi:hypothetical protein F511_21072 [Dorcoceras hygrometricum]|uniref:Endonuclease/exonuclease/phosphatase domain-containing protein n=1 Tax=Dorcoceras hygrometricum TaxID=472368 RepID=A0A2Z7CQM1_9LAMI|nr:hypothetical protein F511_21072 [Dorcoceras hygrometricum]